MRKKIIKKVVAILTVVTLLIPNATQAYAADPVRGVQTNVDSSGLDKAVEDAKKAGVQVTQGNTEDKGTVDSKAAADAKRAEITADYEHQIREAEEAVADLVAAPAQRPGFLVQPRAPVQELGGEGRGRAALGVGVLYPRQPVDFAGEHGVGRGLGGQGEQDAGAAGAGGEHLGGHEGGLGLAPSRGLLDDEQPRQLHGAGRRQGARLDVGGASEIGRAHV